MDFGFVNVEPSTEWLEDSPKSSDLSLSPSSLLKSDQKHHRRRHSAVSLACTNCRSKHLKCDGKIPICDSCNKNGTICVFQETKRRGPKKGSKRVKKEKESSSLDKQIVPSSEEKKAEEQELSVFRVLNHQLQADLVTTSTFDILLSHYQNFFYGYWPVPPKCLDYGSFQSLNDNPSLAYMYAVLTVGALVGGYQSASPSLLDRAKFYLRDIYDVPNPDTLAAHCLIDCYHKLLGEDDKAEVSSALVYSLSRVLRRRDPTNQLVIIIYCRIRIHRWAYLPKDQLLGSLIEMQNEIQLLNPQDEYSKHLKYLYTIIKIFAESAQVAPEEGMNQLRSCMEFFPTSMNQKIRSGAACWANTMFAFLHSLKRTKETKQLAETAFRELQLGETKHLLLLFPLLMLRSIFTGLGDLTRLREVELFLCQMGMQYPFIFRLPALKDLSQALNLLPRITLRNS